MNKLIDDMVLESTATSARPETKSLRATVPEGIVEYLELKNGDRLEWKMDMINGKRVAIVKRIKK